MIALNTPFTFVETVQGTEANDEIIVLDLQKEKFYGLNETGSRVWQELAQGRTLEQTLESLEAEFEVEPQTLRTDVLSLVEQWLANGWIETNEYSTSAA